MEDSKKSEQKALSQTQTLRHLSPTATPTSGHPLSVWRAGRGRGSARPGALSFHSSSAPFLKGPCSATPGKTRVELCWAGSN